MKKILSLITVCAMVIAMVACGGGGGGGRRPQGGQTRVSPRVQVLETAPTSSDWILNGTRVSAIAGVGKAIVFVGTGTAESQGAAKVKARLNAQAAAAYAIRTIATAQTARAFETVGVAGRNEQSEEVLRGLEAAVAKKVNISGLLVVRHWYRYVKKPGFPRPFYEWYTEMAMEYAKYKDLRDGVIRQRARSYRLNARQRVLYRQTERVLNELNNMDGQANGGIPGGQVQLNAAQRSAVQNQTPGSNPYRQGGR